MPILNVDPPVVLEESYDLLSTEAQMAFLYALGHGATISVACKYANASYHALIAQLDLGLSERGAPRAKFNALFSLAFREASNHPRHGQVTLQDLGRGTRFTHAEYLRQLRQKAALPGVHLPLDEFYLDD